jgi:predicted transcriptional regulator
MCARSVFRLPDVLEIRVSAPGDALDRFEAAWNRAAEGRGFRPYRILSFGDLPRLLKTLTPARWELLQRLSEGPSSVYALAKRLERDYKNVHTDVSALVALGLIEKKTRSEVAVAWDAVRTELRLIA